MALAARVVTLIAVGISTLAAAAPASAAAPPACWNASLWARPDTPRTFELYCPRSEHATVAAGPQSARLELLQADGEMLFVRLTPEATAPERDSFTLRLTGPAGAADQVVQITNIPLSATRRRAAIRSTSRGARAGRRPSRSSSTSSAAMTSTMTSRCAVAGRARMSTRR